MNIFIDDSMENLSDRINNALLKIPERERKIIEYRFGLNGKIPKTLQELASDLLISRERVRQIERKALMRLRHPSRYSIIIGKEYII